MKGIAGSAGVLAGLVLGLSCGTAAVAGGIRAVQLDLARQKGGRE